MEILTIIISIISLVVSISIGFWNICLQKREEGRKLEDREKARFDARPRLEVEKFSLGYDGNKQELLENCDLSVVVLAIKEYKKVTYKFDFYYEDGSTDINNWVSATYKFKNVGNTEILSLDISTNLMRDTALFDVDLVPMIEKHCLNYSAVIDKAVKPGDTFTLKVSYMKDKIIGSIFGNATLTIWMHDVYGKIWAQPFFPHDGKLYNSKENDYKIFQDLTQIDVALECFEKPWLW